MRFYVHPVFGDQGAKNRLQEAELELLRTLCHYLEGIWDTGPYTVPPHRIWEEIPAAVPGVTRVSTVPTSDWSDMYVELQMPDGKRWFKGKLAFRSCAFGPSREFVVATPNMGYCHNIREKM